MKTNRVNLYLPENMVTSLKDLAKKDERSLNDYVTRILRRHIEAQTPTKEARSQEARTTEIPAMFG